MGNYELTWSGHGLSYLKNIHNTIANWLPCPRPRGPTPAGISYKLFGIPNGIWNLALESGILRLVEIQKSRNSPDMSVNS